MNASKHPSLPSATHPLLEMTLRSSMCVMLALASVALSGCAIPHIGRSSSAVKGRIMDADSGIPISGATVSLERHPEVVCRTVRSGYFHLRATHYFNWFMWGPEPYYTPTRVWSEILEISCPGYEPLKIFSYRSEYQDDSRVYGRDGTRHLKDISLKPTK